MFETSSDDLFLPPYHLDMVDNLLSNEDSDPRDGDRGVRSSSSSSSSSLAEALLPLVESSCSSSSISSSSALLAPWVCSTRYKTELCTSYAASGLCRYAERCQFAHGLQELHVPYRHPKYKTEPCRSFHATGCCYYGARCLFVHGAAEQRPACRRSSRPRRNVPCRTFRSFGVCPFGTRCNFLHVDELGGGGGGGVGGGVEEELPGGSSSVEERSPAGLPSPTLQAPPPPPREWRPRGALCRTFSSFGFCLYGTRCRFQHGLPNKIRGSDPDPDLLGPADALPSPFSNSSSSFSPFSSSSSPASSSASTSPPASSSPPDSSSSVHNAFTFSSRHLNELLLPLALQLQRLESSQALAASAQRIWDNRAL